MLGVGAVVFVGPSLPLEMARAVLPQATYRPPIAQGDLLTLALGSRPTPWAVGIIDGAFYQSLPVWHKEILYALERGIRVFGAASMGALRAAECAPFGMQGVGEIYRRYARGELTDDDEVALAHEDADAGWRARSEPLVNVRATCEAAAAAGHLTQETASTVVGLTKAMWFPERTLPAIIEATGRAGVSASEQAGVRRAFEHEYVDLKRADALEMLGAMRTAARQGRAGPGGRQPVRVVRAMTFQALSERDRQMTRGGNVVRAEQIARHVAVSHPGYPALRDRALDRLLVDELATLWRVEVTPEEVQDSRRRLRVRMQLGEEGWPAWQLANDVGDADLEELVVAEARARKLRDWVSMCRVKRLLVEPVLNELRLAGEYPRWADETAQLHGGIPTAETWGRDRADATDEELILDQLRAGGWRPDVPLARFADEAGFESVANLLEELAGHFLSRMERRRIWSVVASMFETERTEP
jgi:hypothetical protein